MSSSAATASPEQQTKIDRYGELDRQIQQFSPIFSEHKALEQEIQSWFSDADPQQTITREGVLYTIQLSKRSKKRTIFDKLKAFTLLRRKVGLANAVGLVTIPLEKAIDEHIPAEKHPLFLKEEQTGPRRLSVVAKYEVAVPPPVAA